MDEKIVSLATRVLQAARDRRLKLATAESCTGGLVIAALTDIAGSSDVVDRGFVSYSNAAKTAMLDVPAALIERHGAVSEEVARAMAQGAVAKSAADIAVAVTGIAGPGGGSPAKPVGLVHFACAAGSRRTDHAVHHFGNRSRATIRHLAVIVALKLLLAGTAEYSGADDDL